MKILLIQAYLGKGEPLVFPLGVSSLAASLKEHTVKTFDTNNSPTPFADLETLLERFRPEIVGLSIRNIDSTNKRNVVFYYEWVKKIIQSVDSTLKKNCRIIAGGSGFSMFAQQILEQEPRIDFGVFTEGEHSLPELLGSLDAPEKVKGIYYRKNSLIEFSGPRKQPLLNELPLPDRTVVNLDDYRVIPDAVGVETKRGCAFNCIYCIYGFLNGSNYRLRPPEQVADDIEFLVNEKKITQFTFIDSVFNFPVDHSRAICEEIKRRKLEVSWSAWFNEKFITRDLVQLAIDAGCTKIIFSPDGFSNKTLKKLKKIQTTAEILKAYRIVKQFNGIEICFNFFKNPPGQNAAAFIRVLLFFVKAKLELKNRVHFEFNSLRIEPHTGLFDLAVRENEVAADDDLLYPRYYKNPKTGYIAAMFDLMLRLKGN